MRRFIGDGVCCAVIITLCLALGLPRYRFEIDLGDEGFLAYGAVRVMEGQVPNRDFVSLQPPLSFYTVAAMFKLFGTSLVSLRAMGLCIYVLIPVVLYAISRQVGGRILSLSAALPATVLGIDFFNFVPYAVWQGELTALLAVFFLIRAAITGRRRWSILAGAANSATLLLRHDQGVYLIVAVIIYIFALKFASRDAVSKPDTGRILRFWAGTMAAIMLPLVIYWLACGVAPYMFKQLVVFLLTRYAETSSLPLPKFVAGRPFINNLLIGLFYVPPVIEFLAAIWLLRLVIRRHFYIEHSRIAFILVLSMLFYLQSLTRTDIYHFLITIAPFFVLCGWSVRAVSKAVGDTVGKFYGSQLAAVVSGRGVLVAAGLIVGGVLLYVKPVFLPCPAEATREVLLDRGGVCLTLQRAGSLEDIVKMLQKKAKLSQSILCLPYQPMFYFLSGRHNPTRWNYIWPGDQTPEEHQALINQAKSDPPAVVVIIYESDIQSYAPAIIDYVHREYKATYDIGVLTVYSPLGREKP